MNSVVLLTRLQIKQTLGGLRAAIEKRAGANGAMAGTALIAVMALGGLAYLGYMAYGMLGARGMETTLYNMLFMACGVLTFAFSLPSVLSSFFGSSDTNDLLSLPVSPFAIVLSKALGSLTTSYFWTMLFIAGPMLGWGIAGTLAGGLTLRYWVVYVLAVIMAPLMPTAYSGTIAIIIASVFKRVRRKDAITTLTTVLTLGISVLGFFVSNQLHLSEGAAQVLGGMAPAMGGVVMVFPAYGFAVYALVHADPLGTWLFVLISLFSFAVFVAVARVLYMRIVTSLSSGAGKAEAYDGGAALEQTPVFKALLVTEMRKVIRNSSVLLNYVVYPLLISPALIGVMLMTDSMNDALSGISKLVDDSALISAIALVLLMFMATLCTCSNKIAATGVSREGSNWTHMKFVPVPMHTQVLAKTLCGYVVNALIVVVVVGVGGALFVVKMSIDVVFVACSLVLMLAAAWLMACLGAWMDGRNPNVEWGNDGDVNVKALKSGMAELYSVLVGFVYTALPLVAALLKILDPTLLMLLLTVVGVAASVVLGRMLLAATTRSVEALE